MATLHRMPVMEGDKPEKAGNLQKCQWCGKLLEADDNVWKCTGRLSDYLVCDKCHDEAIVH